jgi:hypothetical protein
MLKYELDGFLIYKMRAVESVRPTLHSEAARAHRPEALARTPIADSLNNALKSMLDTVAWRRRASSASAMPTRAPVSQPVTRGEQLHRLTDDTRRLQRPCKLVTLYRYSPHCSSFATPGRCSSMYARPPCAGVKRMYRPRTGQKRRPCFANRATITSGHSREDCPVELVQLGCLIPPAPTL